MTGRTIDVGGNQGRGDPALTARHLRLTSWSLEFRTPHGAPLVWRGDAASAQAAERLARLELERDHPDAAGARLVACVERGHVL